MRQNRLKEGDPVRPFEAWDMDGKRVALPDHPGRHVLLSFYRYASCPLCDLRVHELSRRSRDWQAHGLGILAVF